MHTAVRHKKMLFKVTSLIIFQHYGIIHVLFCEAAQELKLFGHKMTEQACFNPRMDFINDCADLYR